MKKRLSDKFKQECVLIVCADCGRVKKLGKWIKLTEEHQEKLKNRDIKIILDTCGCLAIKVLNNWKGGKNGNAL